MPCSALLLLIADSMISSNIHDIYIAIAQVLLLLQYMKMLVILILNTLANSAKWLYKCCLISLPYTQLAGQLLNGFQVTSQNSGHNDINISRRWICYKAQYNNYILWIGYIAKMLSSSWEKPIQLAIILCVEVRKFIVTGKQCKNLMYIRIYQLCQLGLVNAL